MNNMSPGTTFAGATTATSVSSAPSSRIERGTACNALPPVFTRTASIGGLHPLSGVRRFPGKDRGSPHRAPIVGQLASDVCKEVYLAVALYISHVFIVGMCVYSCN